ncbi:MAG: hypothetical protein U9O50_09365 [Acidobacteriota bacterium]|nr:hypothetical protein [Acidobacteriota bacterium]
MKTKSLVQFNVSYYKYPNNIHRYPILSGLDRYQMEHRGKWLKEVSRYSHSRFHEMVSDSFADASDDDLLLSILSKHGIFAESFFQRSIRERVARRFGEVGIELQEFCDLLWEAWGFETNVIRNEYDAIHRIVDHLYEQALSRAISDSHTHTQIEVWFKKFEQPKRCSLCNRTFRMIDLPYWIYFGSNGCQDFCFNCPIMMSPKKGELMSLIPAFVEACGFIPNSDANPINYAFTSRLSPDGKINTFLAYAKMGGIEHVKKKFGSWFKALAETGALPNGVLLTARGVRCLAQDGHVCHSLDEQYIDNWLSAQGIPHEREPSYPAHPKLNPNGRRCADWRVGDSFVEYFGLIGDPKYEKKIDEKILLAQCFRVNLIALYPSDLGRLDSVLRALTES